MVIGKKLKELPVSVGVDGEKCVNCHACISACPVKYCNDGSGDFVSVNPFMCIGCGNCITHCTHGARFWVDDFDALLEDLANGQKIIAIVAPSAASSFPSQFLNLNGWLKDLGVEAVFDVSFGAELTVKSYIEYINSTKAKTLISQPCPAIVTYIEMYLPELIPYLAPVDSPMLHTMKMIRKYYPQFAEYRIAAISPCLAKKREFHETGLGEYNVGFKSVQNYLSRSGTDLNSYPEEPYMNPPAERAVGFSSPGGLLKTAERWVPGISESSRKIEGPEIIYNYLDKLLESIDSGTAPALIDCLNCTHGCNGGPLTITEERALDDIEKAIASRQHRAVASFVGSEDGEQSKNADPQKINEVLEEFWQEGDYNRRYRDLSINNRIIVPSDEELKKIYKMMRKTSESDFYNCSSCGYGTCQNMAIAIYNGLNRPENCHFYLAEEARMKTAAVSENEKRLRTILSTTSAGFCLADADFKMIVVNNSFCRIFGMQREKLIGSTILKKQLERCSTGNGMNSEIRVCSPEGVISYYQIIANPYFDENKDLVGYFALIVDISKYRKETNTGPAQARAS
ncbi:MAG: [Fe-Fe] hydrogenase large subunit C-terminal domain-containing protein [Chitinispirillaceae bacterium]